MRRLLIIGLFLFVTMGILMVAGYLIYDRWNVSPKEDYTITISRDYELANHEPVVGTYLGAYVLQNSTIEFSMKTFNKLANKDHVTFFKYVGYGKPFPTSWVEHV